MNANNHQMCAKLDIDIQQRDALLNALEPILPEIYLSQQNCLEGMALFDFVVGDTHGIRVHELRRRQ